MKQTSIESYKRLLEEKIISKRQYEVLHVMATDSKPMTAGEIFMVSQLKRIGHNVVKGSICARLTELEAMGAVKSQGSKVCPLTGMKATLWTVNKLPGSRLKRKSKAMLVTPAQLKHAMTSLYPPEWAQEDIDHDFEIFMDALRNAKNG